MSRKLLIILLAVFIVGFQPAFAADEESGEADASSVPVPEESSGGHAVPQSVENNMFYLESLRLTRLAQETYEYGDYETAARLAREAIRYARLSDEFVANQLKIVEANEAIAEAKARLDWAVSTGAADRYPNEYHESEVWYNSGLLHLSYEEWDETIQDEHKVIDILAFIFPSEGILPAHYIVREWATFRDCLWNIAGYPWVYGDPYKWTVLFNANKSKMPDPNNPNWIEPGMVLDIPSVRGEVRQGTWNSGR
jgi:hypothetical protein